jgi:sulfur carrier protein ThiS
MQTHSDGTITITVNGEHRRVAGGITLAQLAGELGLAPEKVAVERNDRAALDACRCDARRGRCAGNCSFRGGRLMPVARIVPNRYADDVRTGEGFFNEVLGLETAMAMDFIATYRSGSQPMAQISILTGDPSGLHPAYSVGGRRCRRGACAGGRGGTRDSIRPARRAVGRPPVFRSRPARRYRERGTE